MKFIADLHIHSHYSLATSKQLTPEYLDLWARNKGIKVIGTGDFSHPGWTKELRSKLVPAEPGLFKLNPSIRITGENDLPCNDENEPRFVLTAEISSIYKKNDRVRKIHNVLIAPDFESVEKIQESIRNIGGNITSDGRPILGLDAKKLLDMCLNVNEKIMFIPAHIWTPWFSVLGDKSGFDNLEECFEDLTQHIFAVETGLSASVPMHWMCSFLDKFTLLSNSDAHSPEKLGRNANIFNCDLDYFSMRKALKTASLDEFLGTIDMYPQEGKYHYNGHRKCNICWDPVETLEHNGICPNCGKLVTIGVMNRAVQLSDRTNLEERPVRHPFRSIIPLKEILSEIEQVGPNSKKIAAKYYKTINQLGPELSILLDKPVEEIAKTDKILAEAINRMRSGQVIIKEGFDGEYGVIKVFNKKELANIKSGTSLFKSTEKEDEIKKPGLLNFSLDKYQDLLKTHKIIKPGKKKKDKSVTSGLNREQKEAVKQAKGPALVLAGPGTGKTRVLTQRIAYLISEKNVSPANILAITFTNKAAGEIQERLASLLPNTENSATVSTFHSLCYDILRKHAEQIGRTKDFTILSEDQKVSLIADSFNLEIADAKNLSSHFSIQTQNLKHCDLNDENELVENFVDYHSILTEQNLMDLDSLIFYTVCLLEDNPEICAEYQKKFQWILVDEFQDVNLGQYKLLRTLMPRQDANLFVIGDPNQSIYGFRGADIKYIDKFEKDYPKAILHKLNKSYRCSNTILEAASGMRTHNQDDNFLKGLQKGVKVRISNQPSDKSEAEYIARTIENMMGGLRFFSMDSDITTGHDDSEFSLSDFAVLCRTKAQMRLIEKAFNDHAVPYQTVRSNIIFNSKTMKNMVDLVSLMLNPDFTFLKEHLAKKMKLKTADLAALFERLSQKKPDLSELLNDYFPSKNKRETETITKMRDFIKQFGNDYQGFLKRLSLKSDIDMIDLKNDRVSLLTLHAAKGLEFKCVFICGCEKGLLPYSLNPGRPVNQDEQKRLFYVGMTRAKKHLYLTTAKNRFLIGKSLSLDPSPFLLKINEELTEIANQDIKQKKQKKSENQLSLF